jgi:N-acetyl-1-D-myo-inositol-2-amino-2-deoxy-alpha-D-glucopyranoside deacetylase
VLPQDPTGRPARLVFVHAHPDDETLATGVAMAHHAIAGDEVHLLTCTLGEEGEVIPPDLRHLAAGREDRLGPYRREELCRAMAVLGVAHTVLGEVPDRGGSRYRDSGMAGTASAERADAFVRADQGEAAELVAAHLRLLRPDVVVTYDPCGGYAHPDHIQAHRVTMAAIAALPEADRPGRVYWTLTPRSWAQQDREWVRSHVEPGEQPGLTLPPEDAPFPPSVVEDEQVTHEVVDRDAARLRTRALREHRTQVSVHGDYYALSNDIAARLSAREGYVLVDPATGAPARGEATAGGRHTGLLPDT